mmetsp:Transcript_65151/g.108236  ORF Transcript_65151/g.108236 Transcript_65151/m.108236 type:complete len:208 (+) Transcript_65151:3-626(+)
MKLSRSSVCAAVLSIASPGGPCFKASAIDGPNPRLYGSSTEQFDSPLIELLKQRTEANKEQNAAAVRAATEANAYTAIAGESSRTTALFDGVIRFLSPKEIKSLESQGFELSCPPPGSIAPCVVQRRLSPTERGRQQMARLRNEVSSESGKLPSIGPTFAPAKMELPKLDLRLPGSDRMICDASGRNCKFNTEVLQDGRSVTAPVEH